MEQEVFVDVLFMIDFSMDFLCIFLSSKILHTRLTFWRAIIASAVGATYSVLTLFIELRFPLSLIVDLMICILICGIALCNRGMRLKSLILNSLLYLCVCSVVGGLMSAMFNLLNKYLLDDGSSEIQADSSNMWIWVIFGVVSSLLVILCGRLFKRNINKRKCTVTVTFCGFRAEFYGINDSGNLLKDVITGKSVIPVSKKIAASIFSQGMADIFESPAVLDLIDCIQPQYAARIRFIPSTTAVGKGLIVAIVPDKVEIKNESGTTFTVDALVAPLELDGEIEALVPDELMN